MPEEITKAALLHKALKAQGYELPSQSDFETQLQDEKVSEKLYKKLYDDGHELPPVKQFKNDLGAPSSRRSTRRLERQVDEKGFGGKAEVPLIEEKKVKAYDDDKAAFLQADVEKTYHEKGWPSPQMKFDNFKNGLVLIKKAASKGEIDEVEFMRQVEELAISQGLGFKDGQPFLNEFDQKLYLKEFDQAISRSAKWRASKEQDVLAKDVLENLGIGSAELLNSPTRIMAVSEKITNSMLEMMARVPDNTQIKKFKDQSESIKESFKAGDLTDDEYITKLDSLANKLGVNQHNGRPYLRDKAEFWSQKAELETQIVEGWREDNKRYDESITDYLKQGNMGAAIGQTLMSTAETLPLLTALIMGNAVGASRATLGFMGLDKAANEYLQSESDLTMSEGIKIINALGKGLSEIIFEGNLGTIGILKGIKKAVAEQGEKTIRDQMIRAYTPFLERNLAVLMKGASVMGKEAASEGATQLTDNIFDKLAGKDIDVMDGVGDAMIIGGVVGGGLGMPEIRANVQKKSDRKLIKSMIAEMPDEFTADQKLDVAEKMLSGETPAKIFADLATAGDDLAKAKADEKAKTDDQAAKDQEGIQAKDEKAKEGEKKTPEVPEHLKGLADVGLIKTDKEGNVVEPTDEEIEELSTNLQNRLEVEDNQDHATRMADQLDALNLYQESKKDKKVEEKKPVKEKTTEEKLADIEAGIQYQKEWISNTDSNAAKVQAEKQIAQLEKQKTELLAEEKADPLEGKRGRKQVNRGLSKLNEAKSPEDQLNAITQIEQNIRQAPDAITSEEQANIDQIRNDLEKEGYEVPELLGKEWDEGMLLKVETFTRNEDLAPGTNRISRIIQPQINKDGKMVQSAKIAVEKGPELSKEQQVEADKKQAEKEAAFKKKMATKKKKKKPVAKKEGTLDFVGEIISEPLKKAPKKEKKEKKKDVEFPPEGSSPAQVRDWVADNSTDPKEISNAWNEEKAEIVNAQPTPVEEQILEHHVSEQSFIDNADEVLVGDLTKVAWFRKDGMAIDKIAEEVSAVTGSEVTVEDVVETMLNFPNARNRTTSETQRNLESRYTEVTKGRKIENFKDLSTVDHVRDQFNKWLDEVDPFPAQENIGNPIAQWHANKKDVPEELKDAFEKYIEELQVASDEVLGEAPEVAAKPRAVEPADGPKINEKYKGKIVYTSVGLGYKAFAAGRSDVKDGDDILREVLEEAGIKDDRLAEEPGLVGFENASTENINAFKKRAREYADRGFTVITANNFARDPKFVDEVILPADEMQEIAEIGEYSGRKKFDQERKLFEKKGFTVVESGAVIESELTAESEPEKYQLPAEEGMMDPESFLAGFKSGKPLSDSELDAKMKASVQNMGRIIGNIADKAVGKDPRLLPREETAYRKELANELTAFLSAAIEKGVRNVKALRNALLRQLKALGVPAKQYRDYLQSFDDNIEAIKRALEIVKAQEKGGLEARVDLNIEHENPEGIIRAGVDAYLKTFKVVWDNVADKTGVSREMAEQSFFNFAKSGVFNAVTNKEDYKEFIAFTKGLYRKSTKDPGKVMYELAKQLGGMSYEQAVSLFDLYRSMEIVERVGQFTNARGEVEYRTLNSSEHFHTFTTKYKDNLKEMGIANIQSKIRAYDKAKNDLFGSGNKRAKYANLQLTAEERYEMRKAQYAADLQLLEDITGIPAYDWQQYFGPQTKETTDHLYIRTRETGPGIIKDPGTQWNLKPVTFETYDELLKHDLRRLIPGSSRSYMKIETTLVLQLVQKAIHQNPSPKAATKKLNDFFVTDPAGAALSNLYKLSTAMNTTTGLSGRGITGKRFSSFRLASNMTHAAKNFKHLAQTNAVARKHIDKEQIPISEFGGINNKDVIKEASEMTMPDLWVAMTNMFFSSSGEYSQTISQFGDKQVVDMVKVPKYSKVDREWIKENWNEEEFNESVAFINDMIYRGALPKKSPLRAHLPRVLSPETTRPQAELFAYNWARNNTDLTEIFFGKRDNYKDDTELSKRGGSSNSPGMNIDSNIEGGVGKSFRHVDMEEWVVPDERNLDSDTFDGVMFMSGAMAKKTGISLGDTYMNKDEHGEILSSTKSLYSIVTKDGSRGLTKVNFINIDILAEALKDHPGGKILQEIKEFMDSKGIDTVSFYESGTKKLESGKPIKTIDENGKFNADHLTDENIIDRPTENLFVQQDLRHSTIPQVRKLSTQLVANILGLPNGKDILDNIVKLQMDLIESFSQQLNNADKKQWVRDHLNEVQQLDLINLLDSGADLTEPATAKLFSQILASVFNKKALEIPVSRVMAEEIPSMPGMLKGYEEFEGKVRSAQAALGIEGIRYAEKKKSRAEAIQYVRDNKQNEAGYSYDDLFDENGELMEYEFRNDGMIPGEPVLITRIPAGNLNAHTYARATYKVGANFVMLDKESQARSGSDFDGDQRSIQVLDRTRGGKIVKGKSRKALANNIILGVGKEYSTPENLIKIQDPIDTNAYDAIVERIRKEREEEKEKIDLRSTKGYDSIRRRNIAGVDMKGIMSNLSSLYSYGRAFGLKMKANNLRLDEEGIYIKFGRVTNDSMNRIKGHLDNLLNMSFDNAKDPKIDTLGLTPDTANTFVMMLIFDERLAADLIGVTDPAKADKIIVAAIDKIATYMNSEVILKIRGMQEEAQGVYSNLQPEDVEAKALKAFPNEVAKVKTYINLQKAAAELFALKTYQGIMHSAPVTSADYIRAMGTYDMILNNSFKYMDTSGFKPAEGTPFEVIANVLTEIKRTSLDGLPEFSGAGQFIIKYIKDKYKADSEGSADFNRAYLDKVIRLINNVAFIKSVDNLGLGFPAVRKNTIKKFNELKSDDNMFFDYVDITEEGVNKVPTISVKQSSRFSKMPEETLRKIRDDFHRLPDEFKEDLALYAGYVYGPGTGTFNGNFYNFFDDMFRADLSHKLRNEFNRWDRGLDLEEQYTYAEWILRATNGLTPTRALNETDFVKAQKAQAPNGVYDVLDVNQTPNSGALLNAESLDTMATEEITEQEMEDILRETGSDVEAWTGILGMTEGPNAKLTPAQNAKLYMDRLSRSAEQARKKIKNHIPSNVEEELLLSSDPEIQEYIFSKLEENYPGMRMFADREAFARFVAKVSPMGLNTDPRAVGHAFANAIFVDPAKAFQSTPIHEAGHIYWEALPEDNKVKKALIKHFQVEGVTAEQAEEAVMNAIGLAGVATLQAEMKGSWWNRFKELLKRFWRDVKIAIGTAKPTDYINSMAYDVLANKGGIELRDGAGANAVKNHVEKSEDGKVNHIGNAVKKSVTMIVNMLKKNPFNAELVSRHGARLNAHEFKEDNNISKYESEVLADQMDVQEKWNQGKLNGSAAHAVIASVIDPTKPVNDKMKDQFGSEKIFNQFKESVEQAIAKLREKYGPEAKFHPEHPMAMREFDIVGTPDLLVEKANGHFDIIEFKTGPELWLNADGTENPEYDRFAGNWKTPELKSHVSKKKEHGLQLQIYASMLEAQQDSEGNPMFTVDDIFVHQILTEQIEPTRSNDENGLTWKIASAEMAPTQIDMKHNVGIKKKIKRILRDMMQGEKERNAIIEKYKLELTNKGYHPAIVDQSAEMLELFNTVHADKPLSEIEIDAIEKLTGTGWETIEHGLLLNGFTKEHLAKMDSEARFYAHVTNRTPAEIFEDGGKGGLNPALFKPFIAKRKETRVRKSVRSDTSIKHLKVGDKKVGEEFIPEDVYVQNSPLTDVKVGDEIIESFPEINVSGRKITINRKFEVIQKRKGSLLLSDTNSGKKRFIPIKEKNPRFMKVVEKPSYEVAENSYEPMYEMEIKETPEVHYNIGALDYASKFSKQDQLKHMQQARIVWDFFRKYKDPVVMQNMLRDEGELQEAFDKLRTVDEIIGGPLTSFLQNQLANHIHRDIIRKDAKNFDKGKVMAMSLHFYNILHKEGGAFIDFTSKLPPAYFTPTPMIRREHHALNYFTLDSEAEIKRATNEIIEFQNKLNGILSKAENFGNSFNSENLIETTTGDVLSYKNPTDPSLSAFEAEYLDLVYKMFKKYHPDYGSNSITPTSIPVPKVYMLRKEATDSKMFGKYGGRIHDLLSPEVYDNVRLEVMINGQPVIKSLRQLKNEFAKQHIDLTDLNQNKDRIIDPKVFQETFGNRARNILAQILPLKKGGFITGNELHDYIMEAQAIYQKLNDPKGNNPNIRNISNRLPVPGNSNTELISQRTLDITKKVISELIERQHLSKVIPLYESLKTQFHENNGVLQYMIDTYKVRILKQSPGLSKQNEYADETWKEIMEWLLKINSLGKIALSIPVQFANFTIGQVSNFIREPGAYITGIHRLFGRGLKSKRKAFKLAERAGLANLSSEEEYQRINEGIIEKIEKIGYMPMEFAEKLNQIPIFIGLMSKQEWADIDDNGNSSYRKVKNKNGDDILVTEAPDEARFIELETRVQEIHGHYSKAAGAPGMFTTLGRALWQFGKYISTVVSVHFSGHHLERDHRMKVGIVNTVGLFSKVILFNNAGDKMRAKVLLAAKKRASTLDGEFKNSKEFFALALAAHEEGTLNYKEIRTFEDKKNARRLARELFVIAGILGILAFDDDDRDGPLERIVKRTLGDLMFFIDPEYWLYKTESLIPLMSIPRGFLKLITVLSKNEKYTKDTDAAKQGWSKFWVASTRILPYGSAMKDAMELGVWMSLRFNYVTAPNGTVMNQKEINDAAARWKRTKAGLEHSKIESREEFLRGYREMKEAKAYIGDKKVQANKVNDALWELNIQERRKMDKDFDKGMRNGLKIVDGQKDVDKDVQIMTQRELKKKFE